MTKEELLDLFKNYIITTPDGRLVGDKENRFNTWMFSYTGRSGQIYTAPRKKRWASGKPDTRDILDDRLNALGKKNKPTKEIEAFNCGYGYEFKFDHDIVPFSVDSAILQQYRFNVPGSRNAHYLVPLSELSEE